MEKHVDVRDRIQTGDLLFFEGTNFVSRIVQIFTMSSVSHVGMAWREELPGGRIRIFVMHSKEPRGVAPMPLSAMGDYKWLPAVTSAGAKQGMFDAFLLHWGSKVSYSWWGIVIQFFKPLFGQRLARLLSRETSICSRYVAWHRRTFCNESIEPAPTPAELELWAERVILDKVRADGSIRILNPVPARPLLTPAARPPAKSD